jgi:hypothetical protein
MKHKLWVRSGNKKILLNPENDKPDDNYNDFGKVLNMMLMLQINNFAGIWLAKYKASRDNFLFNTNTNSSRDDVNTNFYLTVVDFDSFKVLKFGEYIDKESTNSFLKSIGDRYVYLLIERREINVEPFKVPDSGYGLFEDSVGLEEVYIDKDSLHIDSGSLNNDYTKFRQFQYRNCINLKVIPKEENDVPYTRANDYFRYGQYEGCSSLVNPQPEYVPSGIKSAGKFYRSLQYARCTSLKNKAKQDSVTSGDNLRLNQYQGDILIK